MSTSVLQDVRGLPPSAKLVFKVLEFEGELTQKELVERTQLPSRTVRYALTNLEEVNAIEKRINFMDARQRIYTSRG